MANAVDIFGFGPPKKNRVDIRNLGPVATPKRSPSGGDPSLVTGLGAPWGQDEPYIAYRARQVQQAPIIAARDEAKAIGQDVSSMFQTRRQAEAAGQGGGAPNSYSDPMWDQLEATVAQGWGNYSIADALSKLRLNAEQSNSNQVSPKGARTPYQITPETRQGIMKKFGFDPWSSPENAVRGAAIVLTTYTGRNANYNDPNIQARAFGGYFAGEKGAKNPFRTDLGDGHFNVRQYVQAATGGGMSGDYVNPFDPTYANKAIGEINQGAADLKQPWSTSANIGPMPEAPTPAPVPKTDFTASDAALQALHPVEISLKEQNQIKWKNFWGGLGRAMSTMPEGAGVGDFFLKLGGGVLAGKAAGMDEIQAKEDEYQNKLAKWQAAVYENDFNKAQIVRNELLQDWQASQNKVQQDYTNKFNLWVQGTKPIIGGDGSVYFTSTTPDGKVSMQRVPIGPVIDANAAKQRAGIFMGMFSSEQGANAQVTGVENMVQGQLALATAAQRMVAADASPAEKAAAAAYGAVDAASYAIDSGAISGIIGQDEFKRMTGDVQKQLTAGGKFIPGTKEYSEAFSKMMQMQLVTAMFGDEQLKQKVMSLSPAADLFKNYAADQASKTQTQTTVDSRGRRTYRTTTTEPGGGSNYDSSGPSALDIFQSNFEGQTQ